MRGSLTCSTLSLSFLVYHPEEGRIRKLSIFLRALNLEPHSKRERGREEERNSYGLRMSLSYRAFSLLTQGRFGFLSSSINNFHGQLHSSKWGIQQPVHSSPLLLSLYLFSSQRNSGILIFLRHSPNQTWTSGEILCLSYVILISVYHVSLYLY
jgi:hypothetical protein